MELLQILSMLFNFWNERLATQNGWLMTLLCLVCKHKTLMFRGTFVFNKWGARAIEMPSQCRGPFHSWAMCDAGGLNYLLHSRRPPCTLPLCSTQPSTQSTSRQEAGPLLRGSRICSETTAAGHSTHPPLDTLSSPSSPPLVKNANTEAALHCGFHWICLALKGFVNIAGPTRILLLEPLSRDVCRWHMASS